MPWIGTIQIDWVLHGYVGLGYLFLLFSVYYTRHVDVYTDYPSLTLSLPL